MTAEPAAKYSLTEGSIVKKIVLIALPIMGMQLMQMLYNLTDVFWMGRLSSEAVAASSTAGMFMWMGFGLMLLGRVGAEIGVSQNKGRGDEAAAKGYGQNALLVGLLIGLLYALSMVIFNRPFIGFFNLPAEVAADARLYLLIVSIGLPFEFLFSVLVGVYNASGNSRMSFIGGATGLITNMVLDPLLIFGLNMGIMGAAVATALGQTLAAIVLLVAVKRGKHRPFVSFTFFHKPDRAMIRAIFRWSTPAALESIFFTAMSMIVMRFISGFGTTAITVNKIGSQIESLTWLLGGGFASALTAFIGQNYGAGKWTRIRRGYHLSIRLMLLWGVLITLVLLFANRFLFGIFLPGHAEEIALGVVYGRIIAICQISQCLESVSGSVFKGEGNTMPPFVVSATSNVVRMIVAYFLSKTLLGLQGVWIAISGGAVVRGLWAFVWCRLSLRGKPTKDVNIQTADASFKASAAESPVI